MTSEAKVMLTLYPSQLLYFDSPHGKTTLQSIVPAEPSASHGSEEVPDDSSTQPLESPPSCLSVSKHPTVPYPNS